MFCAVMLAQEVYETLHCSHQPHAYLPKVLLSDDWFTACCAFGSHGLSAESLHRHAGRKSAHILAGATLLVLLGLCLACLTCAGS